MAQVLMKYQTSTMTTGTAIIAGILVDDKRKSAVGSEPGGNLPQNYMLVQTGKNGGEAGIRPRGFNCKATGGKRTFIPALTESTWNGKKVKDKISASGTQWEITSKVPERGRAKS